MSAPVNSVNGRKGGKAAVAKYRAKGASCQLGKLSNQVREAECGGPAVTTIANVRVCQRHLDLINEIVGNAGLLAVA